MNKTSAILQLLSFGYGLMELEFPNNAKPFSLAAILSDTFHFEKLSVKT
jgi:hypothetical protein